MRSHRAWVMRVAALWRRRPGDADLAAELESHLQLHIEESLRAGMTPQAARRDAVLKLGGLDRTKEQWRDRRGIPLLDTLWRDCRFAARLFVKEITARRRSIRSSRFYGRGTRYVMVCPGCTFTSNAISGSPGARISMRCGPACRFKCWNAPSKSSTTPT